MARAQLDSNLLKLAAIAAACGPSLLAYNVSPSPTFLNQAMALALWGCFVIAAVPFAGATRLRHAGRDTALPLAALGLLLLAVLWSWGPGALPPGLALSAAGLLLATAVLLLSGATVRSGDQAAPVFALFCGAWVLAGVLSAGIAVVQVFAPDWPDGDWVARSGLPGRAVGNLRQPNHLSSLLLWAAIAIVPLLELGRLRRGWGRALFVGMIFAVVLTASRTGVLGIAVLALWGLLDRRLSRATRGLLLMSPLMYALAWGGLAIWAEMSRHAFGGEARLAEADLSGSRFGIWANTLAMIRQQPWAGVGFGEFNLAWTLAPFPGRPVAFFDHTHNLPLQLAVELGLPLAALVLGLLLAALWRAWRLATAADAPVAVTLRTAWVMLLLIALHSQLEYPLWYAYFLLPTAWLFGFGLGRPAPPMAGAVPRTPWMAFGGAALILGSGLSVVDYARVTRIFAPPRDGATLSQRIDAGRRSWLFAHHADYAAVTTYDAPALDAPNFRDAPHYLMDTRLMIAWARALAAAGQEDKARHLAQRLREFRNPAAAEFFAPCDARAPDEPVPFQCLAPARPPGWRDYLD